MTSSMNTTSAPILWESSILKCPECGSSDSVTDHAQGRVVCGDCGLVLENELIMDESEWRNFSNETPKGGVDRNRVGGPVSELLEEQGLTTVIDKSGFGDEGGSGNLSRIQNSLTANRKNQMLMEAYQDISRIGVDQGMSDSMILKAKEIFRAASDVHELKSRGRLVLVTSSIFLACKLAGFSRSLRELTSVTNADKTQVGRLISKMNRQEKIRPLLKRPRDRSYGNASSSQLVPRFCSKLGLGAGIIEQAKRVSEKVASLGILEGKSPESIAGGSIKFVMKFGEIKEKDLRSDKEIAQVSHLTDATIRKAFGTMLDNEKELKKALDIEL